MIIVPERIGQLGNQLFHIAHFASASIEHGFNFSFPSFQYSLENFPNINTIETVVVSTSSVRANLIRHRAVKILRLLCQRSPWHECLFTKGGKIVNIGESNFIKNAQRKVIFCEGFGFRDPTNARKHHEKLKTLFQLSHSIRERVSTYQKKLNLSDRSKIVAFHIRRGDYRDYRGGTNFISDDDWGDWISKIATATEAQGRDFKGILFSNEDVSAILRSYPNLSEAPGDVFEDLEMLSRAELIVAPPSTFSGWASFIGDVPLHEIHANCNEFQIEKLKPKEW